MNLEVSLTTKKKTKTLSVRDAVFDLLRELGIDTIFGNPGSTELAFLTPWPADLRLRSGAARGVGGSNGRRICTGYGERRLRQPAFRGRTRKWTRNAIHGFS